MKTRNNDNDNDNEDEESPLAIAVSKKKRKRRSRSSAVEVIDFLTEFKEEKRKEEQQKLDLAPRMHEEKMGIMVRFLDILSKET